MIDATLLEDNVVSYAGKDDPFGDTTTAKEIADSQFAKGNDIIFHAAVENLEEIKEKIISGEIEVPSKL